jgi:hypothetical protein
MQPAEYLKNGFYNSTGEFVEGINGEYSLQIAYQLRKEEADVDQLKSLTDELEAIAPRDEAPDDALDPGTVRSIQAIAKKNTSPAIKSVFDAAMPWVTDWKNYAALTLHLQRILSQTVLIRNLPEGE